MRLLSSITRSLILLAAIAYVLTGISHADVTPAPINPTPEAVPADPDLRSPRATMAYFLSAMELKNGDSDLTRAIKALDVSELPELVREERARETAIKLYAVLSYKEISPSKVPNITTGSPLAITDVGPYGLYFEQIGPNWRFSKSTVRETPDIFREIEHNLSKKEMRKLGGQTAIWLTIRSYVPEQLKGTTFILEDWHWVAALLTLAVAVLLHFTLVFLIRRVVYRLIPSRLSDKPAKTISSIRKPVFVIVFTSALQILLSTFDLQIDFYTFAITWISTVRILATTLLAIRLIPMFTERVHRLAIEGSAKDDILYPLVEKVAWLCIVVIGAVQVLWTHGVNVSGLAAGLGLGGLAFALAAKDTVENIFGAVAILIDQPFKVGDNISMSGINGTVEHIGLRSTRLRTPENSLLSLPNSKVIASHVENLGARSSIRIRTTLNIPLTTPPSSIEALCGGLRAIVSSHPSTVKDSIVVHLNEFNASSLGILVQFNMTPQTWAEEQRRKEEIFLAFMKLLRELRLSLAVPTQEIITIQSTPEPTPLDIKDGINAIGRLGLSWK
jgi:MscS family membrane protein